MYLLFALTSIVLHKIACIIFFNGISVLCFQDAISMKDAEAIHTAPSSSSNPSTMRLVICDRSSSAGSGEERNIDSVEVSDLVHELTSAVVDGREMLLPKPVCGGDVFLTTTAIRKAVQTLLVNHVKEPELLTEKDVLDDVAKVKELIVLAIICSYMKEDLYYCV